MNTNKKKDSTIKRFNLPVSLRLAASIVPSVRRALLEAIEDAEQRWEMAVEMERYVRFLTFFYRELNFYLSHDNIMSYKVECSKILPKSFQHPRNIQRFQKRLKKMEMETQENIEILLATVNATMFAAEGITADRIYIKLDNLQVAPDNDDSFVDCIVLDNTQSPDERLKLLSNLFKSQMKSGGDILISYNLFIE